VNGNLGNSVGALFVRKYFDEQSKGDVSSEPGSSKQTSVPDLEKPHL
jgi:predicted metalloendopeptidase